MVPSKTALSQRMKIQRDILQHTFTTVDYSLDTFGDIPQCRHCGVLLSSWKLFRRHVSSHRSKLTEAAITMAQTDAQKLVHWQSTEQGRRIMPLLRDTSLTELIAAPADCAWLASHCVLCGIFLEGIGGVTHHLKHVHGQLAPRIFQVAAHFWRNVPQGSPCVLCQKTFSVGHYCPVLYQVAICHLLDPQLYAELQVDSSTVFFVLPRDALKGKPKCAHCLVELSSLSHLRAHILKQKCPQFDVNRSDTPTPVDVTVLRCMYNGTGLTLFRDRDLRTRLTLQCQQCEATFTGPPQLMYHLQSCHGALWTLATEWCSYLCTVVQNKAHTDRSLLGTCVCNPGPAKVSVEHQCAPHRQLAMMHIRHVTEQAVVPIAETMLLPFTVTTTSLTEMLPSTLPVEVLEQICQCLQDRAFDLLWTGPLMEYARHRCVLCNEAMTGLDLQQHLQDVHNLVQHGASPVIHTMHSRFIASLGDAQNDMMQCNLCLDHLTSSVQEHLHLRAVFTQVVLLVHLTQDGRILGRPEPGRYFSRADRRVSTYDPSPEQEPNENLSTQKRRRPRGQEEENPCQRPGKGAQRNTRARSGHDLLFPPATYGKGAASTRSTAEIHARRQFLRCFPGTKPTGHAPSDDCRDSAMEAGPGGQEGDAQPSKSTLARGLPNFEGKSPADLSGRLQGRIDPTMPEGQDPSSRSEMADASMESPAEGVRCLRDGTRVLPEAADHLPGSDRSCNGAGLGTDLPHFEGTGDIESHSLDDPVLHALPGHMVCTTPDSAPFSVATSSHEMEVLQPETQRANPTAAEDFKLHAVGTLTHNEHFAMLAPLRFDNDSHWCYTNAALTAWLWSTLSTLLVGLPIEFYDGNVKGLKIQSWCE